MSVLRALVGGELLLGEEEEVVLELGSETDELLDLSSRIVDLTSHRFQFGIGAEIAVQKKTSLMKKS